jgi:WD40 repeat protein
LVGAEGGAITQYDLLTLEPIAVLPGARGEVNSMQWSADERVLLATSNDQTISVYDVPTRTRIGDPLPADAHWASLDISAQTVAPSLSRSVMVSSCGTSTPSTSPWRRARWRGAT